MSAILRFYIEYVSRVFATFHFHLENVCSAMLRFYTERVRLCRVLAALRLSTFQVLNLFLALLLNSFATDSLQSNQDKESQEDSKMKQGWNKIKKLFKRKNKVKQEDDDDMKKSMASIVSHVMQRDKDEGSLINTLTSSYLCRDCGFTCACLKQEQYFSRGLGGW